VWAAANPHRNDNTSHQNRPLEVVLAPDADAGGQRFIDRACDLLVAASPPVRTASDWELEAELEHYDRLLAEVEPNTTTEGFLLDCRRDIAAELVRRSRLQYQRAEAPFELGSVMDRLKREADLLSIFNSRAPQCIAGKTIRRNGATVRILCPFHAERKPSLTIWPDDGHWWCFGCQVGGDAIDAVQRLDGLDFVHAVLRLANEFSLEVPKRERQLRRIAR
jgi:DNA primase